MVMRSTIVTRQCSSEHAECMESLFWRKLCNMFMHLVKHGPKAIESGWPFSSINTASEVFIYIYFSVRLTFPKFSAKGYLNGVLYKYTCISMFCITTVTVVGDYSLVQGWIYSLCILKLIHNIGVSLSVILCVGVLVWLFISCLDPFIPTYPSLPSDLVNSNQLSPSYIR